MVILPVSEEQIVPETCKIYGEMPKKTVDKRRKYGTISPAKGDEGAQRKASGHKRGGKVEAPGRICLRKPLPSGPG